MATLTQSTLSMIESFKGVDGKGRLLDVIEMMNGTAAYCMDDWVWTECNTGTKHQRTIRTGLPTVAWTSLYEGITQSKSQKQNIEDTVGMVEGLSSIDTRQLKLYASNKAAFLQQEAQSYMEAMSQELMSALFYYTPTTNPKYPKGLGARYSTLGTSGAANQVVNAGGAGSDNTSIWFVDWSQQGLSVIYPEGTVGGVQREYKGEQRILDGSSNPYYVEEEWFGANVGFSLGDYRRCARIANIDLSDAQAGTVNLFTFMRKAYYKLQTRRTSKVQMQASPGRAAIYMNRDMLEVLDRLSTNAGSTDNFTRLTYGEVEGKEVLQYRGIPIRECDALVNTETLVS